MANGKRVVGLLAAVALSTGVITLVAGALWMIGSASGERAKFSSLQIAPQDADIFVAINTDPTSPQWLAVNDSLGSINARDPVRRAIDEALADVNLDWEEDILPVAGDEAFFSVPDVSELNDEQGFVAGFLLRDTDKAQEVFDSLRERAEAEGQEYETEEYEGVTIYYTIKPDGDGDPATQSDCRVDDEGTLLCDGQVPLPQNPYFRCVEIVTDVAEGGSAGEAPEQCQPFLECPIYFPEGEQNTYEDTDGDGVPDSCEEADRVIENWELGIDYTTVHQDCADVGDLSDAECRNLAKFGGEGAVALFGDVLAVGASPDEVKSVIDVVQARAPSAETNQRLQEFREGQKEDFLIWGYADLAPVWDIAENAIPAAIGTSGGPGTPDTQPEPIRPPLSEEPPPPAEADFTVLSFDADYSVNNGALDVTERIIVDFGETPKPGISRDISTRLTYDFVYDVAPTIETRSVTRDGIPQQFEQPVVGGGYHRIAIGDQSIAITGQHTYEIQYVVRGAIINVEPDDGEDPYYDIVWNITGDNWGVPIEQASATLMIPDATITFSPCGAGPDPLPWVQEGCSSTQQGFTGQRFAADGRIEPGSRMEFRASVHGASSGAPDPPLIPNNRLPFEVEGESQQAFPFDFNSEALIKELRGAYDRVGFSVASVGDGFALDVTVLHAADYEPRYLALPAKAFDSHFADSVPADTMFFFAGYDLYGQNWVPAQEYMNDLDLTGGSILEDYFGEFETQTGINLEEDILALLTGEYAVAGNVSNFDQETPEFSILAMLDVADADRAQQSLDHIGEYLKNQNLAEIDKDGSLQRWSVPGSGAEIVGITVTGDSLIAGYPDSAVEDAVAGFDDSLSGTSDWQRAMGILPAESTSLGFVSIARIIEEARELPDAERSFQEGTNGELSLEDLTPIRSVGFASTSRQNGFGLHFALFMEDR